MLHAAAAAAAAARSPPQGEEPVEGRGNGMREKSILSMRDDSSPRGGSRVGLPSARFHANLSRREI